MSKLIMTGNPYNQTHLFDGLTAFQLDTLTPLFLYCEGQEGDLIFEQGQAAEYLFVMLDGEVAIWFKPEDGPPITVARVRSGGVVGWSAVLGRDCYTSAAFCETDCQFLRLSSHDLRNFCDAHPKTGALILERLAALIAERLRNTHPYVLALLEQGLRVGVK